MSDIMQARAIFNDNVALLESRGFTLEFCNGLERWQQLMAECGSPKNPAFAAVADDLGMSFWIEENGASVGHGGIRHYEGVRDISELLESGRLWWSPAEALANEIDYVPLPDGFYVDEHGNPLKICGNVIQPGGYFIHPDYQGNKLGSVLDRAIRSAGITAFQADHFVGISKAAIAKGLPQGFYAHERQSLVVRNIPLAASPTDLYLTHCDRQEFLAFDDNKNVQANNHAFPIESRVH